MSVRPETLAMVQRKNLEAEQARLARMKADEPGKVSRVLDMDERAEEAAMRFMDEAWRAGHIHSFYSPSIQWTLAWCVIGTAHIALIPAFRPEFYIRKLEPPCSIGEILTYGALPALSEDEAHHRADRFCSLALDRARQLYRDGFYADPFTLEPLKRPQPGSA